MLLNKDFTFLNHTKTHYIENGTICFTSFNIQHVRFSIALITTGVKF